MNKVSEKTRVSQLEIQSQPQQSKMQWLAAVRAFLQIPNLTIVKVFVLSSLVTFTLGFALALEWLCHGKNHTGFGWIIYYALFLMCLPLLIIGLQILMAICSSSHGSKLIADSAATKEQCNVVSQYTETTKRTEETVKNSCRSLAVVVDPDDKKMPKMKRAVSFPSHGQVRSCRTR